MGFWQALSALAPVPSALADAHALRLAQQQEQQQFAQESALRDAQVTAQKLAAQGEEQRIKQGMRPIFLPGSKPEFNPASGTYQQPAYLPDKGTTGLVDVAGVSPEAIAKYQLDSFKKNRAAAAQMLPDASTEQLDYLAYTLSGLKPPSQLTPYQALGFNQPKLSMTGDVPTVTFHGKTFTSSDLTDANTPPEVKKLLEDGAAAVKQKQADKDRQFNLSQRRTDMEDKRLNELLRNSTDAPIAGNPNLTGEAYLASLPPSERTLVQGVGTGKAGIEKLSYILTKNKRLMNEVIQAYPDFDSSKVQGYISQYHNFTTGKASEQMKAGANAIQHLYRLSAINDAHPIAVHNPGTEAYKRYKQLLNVVTGEVAKFYGMPQTNVNREQLRDPINGLFYRGASIQEQAQAMGVAFNDLLNQWNKAKPSSAYEAPLPGLNASALSAFKKLAPNEYEQFVANGGVKGNGGSAAGQSGAAAFAPPPSASTPKMVKVQIPGMPPGQIPAAALQKFQHDHPNAQVIQ